MTSTVRYLWSTMYPLFFSVSHQNLLFAEKVWEGFPDDWVYLYSKTGRLGARMWDEIDLQELPKARVFVIFWSRDYPLSGGCVREIEKAANLYKLRMVEPVILRLDDSPIFWKDGMDEGLKPVFQSLKVFLDDCRATDPNVSENDARRLISDIAEPALRSDHPRMPRDTLLRALRHGLMRDRFAIYPTCWISGFNGVGRETLVRELNRSFAPNGKAIILEIDEATLPGQLLLRIESAAFGTNLDTLQTIRQTCDETDTAPVAKAIERIYQAGNYLILRHGRIVQEEVELPEWIDDVASALQPGTRPKLFVLSQQPRSVPRLTSSRDHIVSFRMPTMGNDEMIELAYKLIGHFDRNPHRWPDEEVERIAGAASGTPGFLVSIIRSASRFEDFNQIDAMLAQEGERMAEAITAYVRWAFSQLRGAPDEQKTLLFLNDISPCHISDLERVVAPKTTMLRVLGRLINLGLVERETDEIYRLTPLLARRLNRGLIQPELLRWVADAHKRLATEPFETSAKSDDGGHEYIRLESKINAAMLSGMETLPNSLGAFVSAAHWFQAGIRLYHARKWKPAYNLLRKAHQNRQVFRDTSRMEVDRYFCLSATRMRRYPEAEDCISRLDADIRSKPISVFLKADLHEYKREFPEAAKAYERALDLNREKTRRQEFIYRPLIGCILRTRFPDFERAEKHAKAYLGLKRTVFSLSALANVYLEWKYRGAEAGRVVPEDIDERYRDALDALERDPGSGAAPFELYAKEAEFTDDYPEAFANMDRAIKLDPDRFQLRAERWRLMANFGNDALAAKVVRELDQAKIDPSNEAIWPSYQHTLTDTYVRALIVCGQPIALANGFAPELQVTGELGAMIARIRRGAS